MQLYNNNNPLGFFAIIAIGIILFILEIYLIILLHTNNITSYFEEQMAYVVELNEDLSDSQIDKIKAKIISIPEVKKDQIEVLSQEEALKIMINETNTDVFNRGNNPFKPLLIFRIDHKIDQTLDFELLKSRLSKEDGVEGFYHSSASFEKVIGNIKKGNLILLIILLVLSALAIIIMYSLIKIKLINNRFQIKTMELVGADRKLINRLYLKDGNKIMFKAFMMSFFLIAPILIWIYIKGEGIKRIFDFNYIIFGMLIAFLAGYLLVYLTTRLQVNNYLSKHFYELYE